MGSAVDPAAATCWVARREECRAGKCRAGLRRGRVDLGGLSCRVKADRALAVTGRDRRSRLEWETGCQVGRPVGDKEDRAGRSPAATRGRRDQATAG